MNDPARLSDPGSTASDGLRSLLRNARVDRLTAAELERAAARLGPSLSGLGPAIGGSAARRLAGIKIGAAVAGLTAIVAAGVLFRRTPSHPPSRPEATAVVPSAPPGGRRVEPPPAPLPAAAPAPDPAAGLQPPEKAVASSPRVARPRRAKESIVVPPPETPRGVTSDAGEEAAILRHARQSVATDPAGAFALTEEHARRFATGVLAQEREAIAIEALVALGRRDAAELRARRFLDAHPQSALRGRIETSLRR